jgi:hypothetical protein
MEEADTRDDVLHSLGFPAIGPGIRIPSCLNLA